jgi:hypothetical protein
MILFSFLFQVGYNCFAVPTATTAQCGLLAPVNSGAFSFGENLVMVTLEQLKEMRNKKTAALDARIDKAEKSAAARKLIADGKAALAALKNKTKVK